jgi:hypothetical protein
VLAAGLALSAAPAGHASGSGTPTNYEESMAAGTSPSITMYPEGTDYAVAWPGSTGTLW